VVLRQKCLNQGEEGETKTEKIKRVKKNEKPAYLLDEKYSAV
jgi:hypothetical protein